MNEFFKPLRRKIGFVTMAVACLFTVGWIRSGIIQDSAAIPMGDESSYELISADRYLIFATIHATINDRYKSFRYKSDRLRQDGFVLAYYGTNSRTLLNPIPFGRRDSEQDFGGDSWQPNTTRVSSKYAYLNALFVPYWSVVIPLTLFSVWLLLSNPRQPRSQNATVSP